MVTLIVCGVVCGAIGVFMGHLHSPTIARLLERANRKF